MHRTNQHNEADLPPDPEVAMRMGPLIEELLKGGVFVAGEGLRASKYGIRLNYQNQQRSSTPGPFTESPGLISGFTIVQMASLDTACDLADRFAGILGDVEIDIRPVMEMWHLGFCPEPEGLATARYMLTYKPAMPPLAERARREQAAKLAELVDELRTSGPLLMHEELGPAADSLRLSYQAGVPTVLDGPFTEAKELIAGFSILDLGTRQDVVDRSTAFAQVVGDVEIDVRPLSTAGFSVK